MISKMPAATPATIAMTPIVMLSAPEPFKVLYNFSSIYTPPILHHTVHNKNLSPL